MHFQATLAATVVALSISIVLAAPRPAVQRTGAMAIPIIKDSEFASVKTQRSIDFDELDAHVESLMDKVLRGLDNYERNTGVMHPFAVNASVRTRKRGAGVSLTAHRKRSWYGTISVGTEPRPFSVVFDTGSADTFLPSSKCDSTCNDHTRWDTSLSSTAKPVGRPFENEFGDGSSVSGDLYTDNVTIAGIMATTQTIGAALRYSPRFQVPEFPADGLMGMAFGSISNYMADPIFATLVNERKVTEELFSFKLNSTGGELYIGGSNEKLYKGDITFTPVTQEAHWQVTLQNVMVNDEVILENIVAIIDTGSNVVAGDPGRVLDVHKAFGGTNLNRNGYYSYPCESVKKISFTFNGRSFPISPQAFNLGRISATDCVSGIVEHPGSPFWVVGSVFLQSVYTVFDFGKKQVGFAELKAEPRTRGKCIIC